MIKIAGRMQCGTLVSLALLFSCGGSADDSLPEANFLLIEDLRHPQQSRLLIFNDSSSMAPDEVSANDELIDERRVALSMTRLNEPRQRVLGLTLLSGDDSAAALHAAMNLLYDGETAVREEAIQLVMLHPDADVNLAIAIGSSDPALRVRIATADLVDEMSGD